MFEKFEMGRVPVGDVEINYVAGGDGAPVLLLHGYPQNLAMWARVAPLLASGYRVICADLRGYGDSSKPAPDAQGANYAFRAMAEDNLALMRALGHERFHVIGHDRGGRCGHRLALDHPGAVASLAVLDIVPTHTMFSGVDRHVAGAYWHWYFLSQPSPFPERLIAADPDFFFETCMVGWGKTALEAFDPEQLAEYRRSWRDPAMIAGSCADYRAAPVVDFAHDETSIAQGDKVACPTLVFYGAEGVMGRLFNLPAAWAALCRQTETATLPGGHFFVDQFPEETAEILSGFLSRQRN